MHRDERISPDDQPLSRESFADLVASTRGRIMRWAGRLTGDPDEAEDIAQDVLLRLHEQVDAIHDRGRLLGWLHRVTRNIAHDRRIRATRRRRLLERFGDPSLGSSSEDGSDRLDAEAMVRLVAGYRRSLTTRQRQVFTMIDIEGGRTAEVAERLGMTTSTVRVHLARARQAIRLLMLAEHPELLKEYKR